MRIMIFYGLLCLLLAAACSKDEESQKTSPPVQSVPSPIKTVSTAPPAPLETRALLQQPLEAALLEMPNQALPIWRQYAKGQPVLVILSNVPYTLTIPEEMLEETQELLHTASDQELEERSRELNADPVIMPFMSVRAALLSGFFSRAVWIFPPRVSPEELKIETFRGQMVESGMATSQEAESFILQGGGFHGTIAGRPFSAIHQEAVSQIDKPVVLHFDMSFFQPIYKGEIKTPLYPLLVQTLSHLKDQQWEVAAVGICRFNQPGGLPLDTRFVGKDLAEILRKPSIIIEELPLLWARRAEALYLENFMRKDEIREIYLEMEKTAPKDPSVKYALYQTARQFREGDRALAYLREAVELDPVYANEYLVLADLALEKKGPDKALEMMQLAQDKLPDNPFITMSMARTALNAGHRELASKLLSDLQKLPWSNVYYPGVESELQELVQLAQKP